MSTPKEIIDFATAGDAATFLNAVNTILNNKTAEALGAMSDNMANQFNQETDTDQGSNNEEV